MTSIRNSPLARLGNHSTPTVQQAAPEGQQELSYSIVTFVTSVSEKDTLRSIAWSAINGYHRVPYSIAVNACLRLASNDEIPFSDLPGRLVVPIDGQYIDQRKRCFLRKVVEALSLSFAICKPASRLAPYLL